MASRYTYKHQRQNGFMPGIRGLPLNIIIALLAIVAVQQVFFLTSLSPLSFNLINNKPSSDSASALLDLRESDSFISDFKDQPLRLTLQSIPGRDAVTVTIPADQIGITIDEARLGQASSAHARNSLIPVAGLLSNDTVAVADYIQLDKQKLAAYAQGLHEQYLITPVNAEAHFSPGENTPTFTQGKVGYGYGSTQIADALYAAAATQAERVSLSAEILRPIVDEQFLSSQQTTLETLHDSKVTFTDGDHSYTLNGNNDLLSTIEPTTSAGYTFNSNELASLLDKWITPQFTKHSKADRPNTNALAGLYASALRNKYSTPIQIQYTSVTVIADTSEDAKQTELQDLVTSLGEKYGAAITVRQLDNDAIHASYDAGRSRVAASTYKLLVAYAVAQDVSEGRTKWTDPTYNRSTRSCLESMIVYSTNHCAKNWVVNEYGYDYINDLAASLGLLGTCFDCGEYTLSSTDDQVRMMELFYIAEGLDRDVADIVLDMLDRSRGESAIPLATGPPYTIYNKIGWVPGHYNDTAIIEFPDATVGLSVYTDNNGWGQIRAITKEITPFFK